MTRRDDLKVLGLADPTDATAVKKAYYRLALLRHPDKGGTKEQFQVLVACFERLDAAQKKTSRGGGSGGGGGVPYVFADNVPMHPHTLAATPPCSCCPRHACSWHGHTHSLVPFHPTRSLVPFIR